VLHLWPNRVSLASTSIGIPRPFSGRTSGIEAHLLADEAAYVLGVTVKDDGTIDDVAPRKHTEHFRPLYQALRASPSHDAPELMEAIDWLDDALEKERVQLDPLLNEVRSKDWVSIVPEVGPLAETHLFMHPAARAFWIREMTKRCSRGEAKTGTAFPMVGQCAICGESKPLVRKLPLKVKLAAATPLHSLNASAFTSYIGGPSPEERAHTSLCFVCADVAARAFNHLGETGRNRVRLAKHPTKTDALANQYALHWLKAPSPLHFDAGNFDPGNDLDIDWAAPLAGIEQLPQATLQQMENLLKIPWTPKRASLNIDDFGFYLAILSPNVGRIAVREWLPLSIETVRTSLAAYLDATMMVTPSGDRVMPVSIATIVEALGSEGADMTRALVRTAYTQSPPPRGLLFLAGQRLNALNAHERSLRDRQQARKVDRRKHWDDRWPLALAAAIKMVRYSEREEMPQMSEVNVELASAAYHCGRLLAVLEEAQQVYTKRKMGKRLDVSIVQRAYGGACSTPASVLGRLYKLASTAHLPDSGAFLNREAEAISTRLVELGGMPTKLGLASQAEFGLGFYQQRARIRSDREEWFATRGSQADESEG
jgi:CRISPR-associated protein Csd1